MRRCSFAFPPAIFLGFSLLIVLSIGAASVAAEPKAIPRKTQEGPPFAIVCLGSTRVPDSEEMGRLLEKWLAAGTGPVTDLEMHPAEPLTMSFNHGGKRFSAGLLDQPIPPADLEYACGNALFWPDAGAVLDRHKAHLIVTALGDYEQPWQRALDLSRVMAACLEAFDGIGVYWGHASVVHSPEFFLQGVREAGGDMARLPVELWTGFLLHQRGDQTLDMVTDGLDVFGCMEFEIVQSAQTMDDIFEMLIGISRYAIFNGNVISDGDTVSASAGEALATCYAPSVIGRSGRVIRIGY